MGLSASTPADGPDIPKWKKRIAASKRVTERLKPRWAELDDVFYGKSWSENISFGEGLVDVPQAFTDFRLIHNTALARFPKVLVSARNDASVDVAATHEIVANYNLKECKVKKTASAVFQDNWKYCYGIAWLGYDTEEGYYGKRAEITPELRDAVDNGMLYMCDKCQEVAPPAEQMPMMGEPMMDEWGQPMMDEMGQPMMGEETYSPPVAPMCPKCAGEMRLAVQEDFKVVVESSPYVRKGMPFVVRVSPRDFGYQPSAEYPDEAGWVWRKYIKPVETVKAHKWWKNTKDLKGKQILTILADQKAQNEAPKPSEDGTDDEMGVEIYEIWNRKYVKGSDQESDWEFIVLCDEHDLPLFYDADPWRIEDAEIPGGVRSYPIEGPPCVVMQSVKITDRRDPVSDLQISRPEYMEVSYWRSLVIALCHRQVPGLMARTGTFGTTEQRNAFTRSIPGALLEVDDPSGITQKPVPSIQSTDWQINMQAAKQNLQERNGVTPNQRATRMPNTSATEANLMAGGSDLNMQTHVDAVEEFYRDVVRKLMLICRHFWIEPYKWIPIAGQAPMQVTKEQMQAEVEFDIEMGSTQPKDDPILVKQLTDVYMMTANDPFVNRMNLLKRILGEMDIRRTDDIVEELPEEGSPESELYLMFAGIPVPPTQQGNLGRHLEVEGKAMEALNQLPPEQAQFIGPIIEQHMAGEQAAMQGQGAQGGGPGGQQPLTSPYRPGAPDMQQIAGSAMNVTNGAVPNG